MKYLGRIRSFFGIASALVVASIAQAETYYISPDGSDQNPGTEEEPLKTIQTGINRVTAGDTLILREGRYRESGSLSKSGTASQPIRIMGAPDEDVVIDGTETVPGPWTDEGDGVWSASWSGKTEQIFFGEQMLVEARWPNMKFPEQLWMREDGEGNEVWASSDNGSTYSESTKIGTMVDAALAATGIDFTGAKAMLNVSHQFRTWTAVVENHSAGSDTFNYDGSNLRDLRGPNNHRKFNDDFYYLFGIREALDAPTEWYHDFEASRLYVIPPEGRSINDAPVRVKVRTFGLQVIGNFIELLDLHFLGCTISVKGNNNLVSNCHFLYPSYDREVWPNNLSVGGEGIATKVEGDYNRIEYSSLSFPSGNGLFVDGAFNEIENNLVHDFCWSGAISYSGIDVNGTRFGWEERNGESAIRDTRAIIRRNTSLNGGNTLVNYRNGNHLVEFNHMYNGGLVSSDVSLLYTISPRSAGSVARYNWVHRNESLNSGMGIRTDDKGREHVYHHNVIFDSASEGILVKGDYHAIFNNTSFDNARADIMPYATPEVHKEGWLANWPTLPEQNVNTLLYSNATGIMTGERNGPLRPGGEAVGNYAQTDIRQHMMDPDNFDFRPKPGSPLIDGGAPVPGHDFDYVGSAPDIGAYEAGQPYWVPGIEWDPAVVMGFVPLAYIYPPQIDDPDDFFAINDIETVADNGSEYAQLRFEVEDSDAFSFEIQRSSDLLRWRTILRMSDPGAAASPMIVSTESSGGRTIYTVRDDMPLDSAQKVYYRLATELR